jgi:hypothetical protein
MNPVLEKWLNTLETDRKELCNSLSGISQDQFTQRPFPGKWSISEIVSHLLTADRLSLDYMKKKSLAMETLKNAGWFEELKMIFFMASQRVPIKYNAPQRVVQSTPRDIDIATISNDWEVLLLDYRQFLSGIPEQHTRKKIYKHPILGRLDAKLCLQSIYEHYHHHLPQIKRLL